MENTNRKDWILLWILFLGYTIVYTDKIFVGIALVPISKALNLTPGTTGAIMSAFFLGYAIMQIPSGLLIDKIGAKKILILVQILIGIFAVLFGFGWSLTVLIAIRFCTGVIHAGYPVSCSKTVATTFPVEKRTFPQSILLASSGLGGIIASLGGAYLVRAIGYKYTYIGFALCAVGVGVLLTIFAPAQQTKVEKVENREKSQKISVLELLKNPVVFILVFAMLAINMDLYGITSWLPSYLVKERGLDIITAGKIQSISMLGGGVAAVLTGYLVGKYMQNKESRVIVVSTVIASICLYFIYGSKSLAVCTSLLFVGYTCLMIAFVTMFTLPLKRLPQSIIGVSMGIVNTGGVLGGFLAPIIIGHLVSASHNKFGSTFVFLSISSLISGLLVLFIKKEKTIAKQEIA